MAINSSPRCVLLLLLAHLIAALAVYAAPLSPSVSQGMFLLVSVSLIYFLARDALVVLPVSWRRLSVQDGVATILTRDGSVLAGQVLGSSVVTPWVVVLRINPDGKRWSVARSIFPDAMENDAFRELCVRLRYP